MNESNTSSGLSKRQKILDYVLRTVVAVILIQSLFFKFTGASESMYIFAKLGVEPWGRILTGILELIASLMILIPFTVVYGALLSLFVITGALFSHIFSLGIAIQEIGDGGSLFVMALIVFAGSAVVLYQHRDMILVFLQKR